MRKYIKEAESSCVLDVLHKIPAEKKSQFIDLYLKRNPTQIYNEFISEYENLSRESQVLLYKKCQIHIPDPSFELMITETYWQTDLFESIIKKITNKKALCDFLQAQYSKMDIAMDRAVTKCILITAKYCKIPDTFVKAVTAHMSSNVWELYENGVFVGACLVGRENFCLEELDSFEYFKEHLPMSMAKPEAPQLKTIFSGQIIVLNDFAPILHKQKPKFVQEAMKHIQAEDEKRIVALQSLPSLITASSQRIIDAKGMKWLDDLLMLDCPTSLEEYRCHSISALINKLYDDSVIIDKIFEQNVLRTKIIMVAALTESIYLMNISRVINITELFLFRVQIERVEFDKLLVRSLWSFLACTHKRINSIND